MSNEMAGLRSRRVFLAKVGVGMAGVVGAYWWQPGVLAEELAKRVRTPSMTEGPFFPDRLPLDTDNDLLVVNDGITPAVGEVTHLTGRVLDVRGNAVRNALVEIWQVDAKGCYLHSGGVPRGRVRDGNFQGYGRFLTGSSGEYYFRTIKPVGYPGRTPHIHVKVKVGNREVLTTQFFVAGEKGNERDGIFKGVRDEAARRTIISEYVALEGSKTGELSARYEVVLGVTPEA